MNKQFLSYTILLLGILFTLACSFGSSQAPAPTIQSASTSLPGWKQFTAGDAEIWLPESFEGGDPAQDLDTLIARLRALGPAYAGMADTLERNPSLFALMAIDSNVGDSGYLTNVNIGKDKVLSVISLDTYGDAFAKSLPPDFKIIDRKHVKLERYDALRLVDEMELGEMHAMQLLYFIKDGNIMWFVVYTAAKSGFEQALPVFEQSMKTFTVQP